MLDLASFVRPGGPDRTALQRWLGAFDPAVAKEVLDGLDAATAVVGPTSELVRLGNDPEDYLPRLGAAVTRLESAHPNIDRLLWLLNGGEPAAPWLVEMEAAIGTWLHIDLAAEVSDSLGRRRTVIRSGFRHEYVGVCFALPPADRGDSLACLETIAEAGAPVSALFVTREQAVRLQQDGSGLAQHIMTSLRRGQVALGLQVCAETRDRALADLVEEARPLRQLAGDRDVLIARFSPPPPLSCSKGFTSEMRRAGFAADASFRAPADPGEAPVPGRGISYFSAGAYQPQVFDLRSPAGHWRPDDPVAMVTLALAHRPDAPSRAPIRLPGSATTRVASFTDWDALWAYRTIGRAAELPRHIEHASKQAYLEAMQHSVELKQRYDEFMVYNWPPPDPATRVTLVDGGPLDRPGRVSMVLAEAESFVRAGGKRRRLVGQEELLHAARAEARSRTEAEVAGSLELQRREHRYLSAIKGDELLREDLQAFLGLLPPELGRTLEIGSGYGQLARALAPRAARYICLDLAAEMIAGLDLEGGGGLVADAHHLPFGDASFETLIANNSIEHLYDPLAALREIRRVLKPRGHLYAIIPLDQLAPHHVLRTHLWKADPASIEAACTLAELAVRRLEVIDLTALGVAGSFPSCRGLVAMLDAEAGD